MWTAREGVAWQIAAGPRVGEPTDVEGPRGTDRGSLAEGDLGRRREAARMLGMRSEKFDADGLVESMSNGRG